MIIPQPGRCFKRLSQSLSGLVRDQSEMTLNHIIIFNKINILTNNTGLGCSSSPLSAHSIDHFILYLFKTARKYRHKFSLSHELKNKPKYLFSFAEFSIVAKPNATPLFIMIVSCLLIISYPKSAWAQQHSYDPNTDNDDGQQFGDCLKDINRYCKPWAPLLFELENCLQGHIAHLTPACRSHMENTDFRKYHSNEWRPPDFRVSGISRKSGTTS